MDIARKVELDVVPEVVADLERQIGRFQGAEIDVTEDWRAGTDPSNLRAGQCYEHACRYATNLALKLPAEEQIWLVHGEYGLSVGHAWVELPGGVLFDAVLQRFYRRSDYYEVQFASALYKYSPAAAMIIAANMHGSTPGTTRWGGWHVALKLPPADPQNPTVIDHNRAHELLISSGLRPDLARPKKSGLPAKNRRRR
jgi:hypothetical protein